MRGALLTATLAVVLAASALNLFLGGVWVAAFLAVGLLRRRRPWAAWLILALALTGGAAAAKLDGLAPPPPASYEVDEAAWLGERLRALVGPARGTGEPATPGAGVRARLRQRRLEELRYTAGEVERRGAAAVAASAALRSLRPRAPVEVSLLEGAVRRLALTLTAPEFHDLEGRRARLTAWLADLEGRLRSARDDSDLEAVARALEPAAMAPVSFRALHEDLRQVDAAMRGLVHALSGGDVRVRATSRLEYDEQRNELVSEDRYRFQADARLGIQRVDLGVLRRRAVTRGAVQTLSYRVPPGEPRELPSGGSLELVSAPEVVVTDRRAWTAALAPVRPALRPIPFRRQGIEPPESLPPEFLVTVALDHTGGAAGLLALEASPPRLESVAVPAHAFHHASAPGAVVGSGDRDVWAPMDVEWRSDLVIETVPATAWLRNPMFRHVKAYLYTPNPATGLAGLALAALAHILIRRPRAAPPAAGVAGG